MAKQIYNYNFVINANGSAATNKGEYNINVPFKVAKIVFYPPKTSGADSAADWWLIRHSIVNGYAGFLAGVGARGNGEPVTFTVHNAPMDVSGSYSYTLLSASELTGGAAVYHTGKIWQRIEFHEA